MTFLPFRSTASSYGSAARTAGPRTPPLAAALDLLREGGLRAALRITAPARLRRRPALRGFRPPAHPPAGSPGLRGRFRSTALQWRDRGAVCTRINITREGADGVECSPAAALDPQRGGRAAGRVFLGEGGVPSPDAAWRPRATAPGAALAAAAPLYTPEWGRAPFTLEVLFMSSRRGHCGAVGPHGCSSRLRETSLFFFFFPPPAPCCLRAAPILTKETGGKMAT